MNRFDDVAFGQLLEVGERIEEQYGLDRQDAAYVALGALRLLWPEMFGAAALGMEQDEIDKRLGKVISASQSNKIT